MQPRKPSADFPNPFSLVDAGVVPDHEDVPAKVAQQVPEELADLVVPDVVGVALKVEADAPALRRKGDARDHGDAIMPVAMVNDGRLAARSPGLSYRGDQEEARLVDEDDVGTQPRSVFFTLGHVRRFHRSMASSSRSSARRSGFW